MKTQREEMRALRAVLVRRERQLRQIEKAAFNFMAAFVASVMMVFPF